MLDDPAQAAFEVVAGPPVNGHDSDLPAMGMPEDQKFEKAEHPFRTHRNGFGPRKLPFWFSRQDRFPCVLYLGLGRELDRGEIALPCSTRKEIGGFSWVPPLL